MGKRKPIKRKPIKADPLRWTVIIEDKLQARKFATQAEAEAELAKAREKGQRGFVNPPLIAWAGKY